MRLLVLAAALAAITAASACQTTGDEPNGTTYSRSDTNKARTDDPVKALQRY